MKPEAIMEYLVPAVNRLAGGEFFAPRSSACVLIPVVHKASRPDIQAELRRIYAKLVGDETPMVRRTAATNLGALADSTTAEDIKTELLPLFTALMADDQDTVRQLVVDSAVNMMRRLRPDDVCTLLVPALHLASKVCCALNIHAYLHIGSLAFPPHSLSILGPIVESSKCCS